MINDIERIQSLLRSVWPNWRITGSLGKGSFGSVYEIVRDDLGSSYKCALKVLEMEADDQMSEESATIHASDGRSRAACRTYSQSAARPGFDGPARQASLAESTYFTNPETGSGNRASGRPQAGMAVHGNFRQGSMASSPAPENETQAQAEYLEDFVREVSGEIDLMMQLRGTPNIVSIEDYMVLRGTGIRTILIRMELLQGVDRIARTGRGMNRDEVVRLGIDICSALERCEEKHILHRDIKPGNLFYSENAGYKLGDFGISRTLASFNDKMSMTGVGTAQYMAPEVFFGQKYDSTVDIYSLGLTLYTLLNNNRPPFYGAGDSGAGSGSSGSNRATGSTDSENRRIANMRRLKGEPLPPPAQADRRLSSAILMACSPDPAGRFQTASAFRTALRACLSAESEPVSGPVRSGRPDSGRSPLSIGLFAAGIALLILAGILFFTLRSPSADQASGGQSSGDQASGDQKTEVSYSVILQDTDGNILEQHDLQGEVGERITFSASHLDGYSTEEDMKYLVLSEDESENTLVFTYEKTEPASDEGGSSTAEADSETDSGSVQEKPVQEEEPDYIQWTDENLEKAVQKALGITGSITPEEAAKHSELDLESAGIHNLDGLQYFTGLETLSLADNFVEDLTPLSGLTDLRSLNLEKNILISDVSPLKDLTGLHRLDLYQNSVSDISSLAGLVKLTNLDLRENYVSDISAVSGMISMKELYLSGNGNITDISPLSGMTSLRYAGLKDTGISDISPLSRADLLDHLVLANTKVSDIGLVTNFPKLVYLDVRNCPVRNTALLEQLRKKKGFELEY